MNLRNTLALYNQLKQAALRQMYFEKVAAKIDPRVLGYFKAPLSRVMELAPDIAEGEAFMKAIQHAARGATPAERAGTLLRNLRMVEQTGASLGKPAELFGYTGDNSTRAALHVIRAMKEFERANPTAASRATMYRMFSRMNPRIRQVIGVLNDYKRLNRAIDQHMPFMRLSTYMI